METNRMKDEPMQEQRHEHRRDATSTRVLGRCIRAALGAASYGWLLLGTACGGAGEPDAAPEQRGQDIIGGFRAESASLNHTGAFVAINPNDDSTFELCTATLIAPETVVTARHCALILPVAETSGFGVAWAAGPDARAPIELISIAAAETASGDIGGFVNMGHDVAVLHLDHPTNIPPAVPRPFGAELVGTSMVSIGYGVHGATGMSNDQRRIGRETVAAVEGRALEHLLGSFENVVEWYWTGEVTSADILATGEIDEATLEFLRTLYDELILLEQHEAVTGLAPSDTQTCYGDSGGPLALMAPGGVFETFGVVSGGLGSLRSACDFGTVYSVFGPASFAFLESAVDWVDPCGEETAAGRCDGAVARRCDTSFTGGFRRVVVQDCAAQDLECVASESAVGCGSVREPEPAQLPEAGDTQALLRALQAASRPEAARTTPWSLDTTAD
jgi:Trypsin